MFGNWKKIGVDGDVDKVPQWVQDATNRYAGKHTCYDKMIYFKGKNWLYKVWFEMIEQGHCKAHFYKKKRKKDVYD